MPEERRRVTFQDETEGPEWVAVYHLGYDEFDDSFESEDTQEIIFNAADFDMAVRYAQQYLRKMKTEESTKESWSSAEILSVEMH